MSARRSVPRATYRVQLHAGFTFDNVRGILPYLRDLGISHLFCSPVLQAAPGSTHGYDIVDHGRVSSELGGEDGWLRLTDAVREHGMGTVLDIVPNHMAIGEGNRWWWDVLSHGRASEFASFFDIEWDPPESRLRDVILLPVLADHYGRVLEAGGIRLAIRDDRLIVRAADRAFPLDPATMDAMGGGSLEDAAEALNADADALDSLLNRQHYRLAHWRSASRDLGYRRFFDIDDLVGLRVEDERVFAETHALPLRWVAEGRVDGLRVDHPDGLRDPAGYFTRLRAAAPDAWIVAEKILELDEALPTDWPVDGTTGYGFANLATGIQVAREAEAPMTELWNSLADAGPDWESVVADARAEVLSTVLGSDVNRLTDLFLAVCEAHRRYRDFTRHELHHALRAAAASLPVYRTYVRAADDFVAPVDAVLISEMVERAASRRPDLDPELFELLGRILRLELGGPLAHELAMRFQQLTPPAMAKGVEDTSFYRHHRLAALNEVGGDPGRFGVSADAFHHAMADAASVWPAAGLVLSTHDTKRSADVRARLALVSADPAAWRSFVERWLELTSAHRSGPDQPTDADVYLLLQVLVGAWPIDADRAAAYMAKAIHEAKLRTSWTTPDAAYDAAVDRFVRESLADVEAAGPLGAFATGLVDAGQRAALAQVALHLTAPGIPDIYQGGELWDLSLVDPDNRRAVDYDLRRRLLDEAASAQPAEAWARRDEGLAKLWLHRRLLELRARRPEAFAPGATYAPITAVGIVAYVRGDAVVVVVPQVATGSVPSAELLLPDGEWTALDGATLRGPIAIGELLTPFPVAILEQVA
ncbi:MAG: malto-oligosyltrehalose synthase [Candidatus Limnocylindria bacterium]